MQDGLWSNIRGTIQKSLATSSYDSWIAPLCFDKIELGVMHLKAPSRFAADLVRRDYLSQLLDAARTFDGNIVDVRIESEAARAEAPAQLDLIEPAAAKAGDADGSNLSAKYTFGAFIEAPSNAFALAAAKQALSEAGAYNPLVIHAPPGCGKSHLVQAYAAESARLGRRALYLSADRFTTSYIKAVRDNNLVAWKERLRAFGALVFDDVQLVAGKEGTARELAALIDFYLASGRQVMIAASESPYAIAGMADALKSRLVGGLVVDMRAAEYDLRRRAAEAYAEAKGVKFGADVLDFVAARITASVREVEAAIARLAAQSILMDISFDAASAKRALSDILAASAKSVSIENIKKLVAERFGVSLASLESVKKTRDVAVPRMVAMHLARTLTPMSLPEIGRAFRRNHATVIHALKKVAAMSESAPKFAAVVAELEREITNR